MLIQLLLTLRNPAQRLGGVALLICAIASLAHPAKAEGSRELTSNGGYRPFLEFKQDASIGISRRTIVKVFARSGETINLGSSATGLGAGNIRYRNPNGAIGDCTPGVGLIQNRAAELAGPRHPTTNTNSDAFTPCIVNVTVEGIWDIYFESPDQGNNTNPTPILANAAWTQPNNVFWIAAWDVTVRSNNGTAIPGRAFANYLALNMGTDNIPLNAKTYIQTADGYGYVVDTNGIEPFGFIFFANSRGFKNSAGNPIYRSLQLLAAQNGTNPSPNNTPSGFSILFPSTVDNTYTGYGDYTHKIFFNINGPDQTMPSTAPAPRDYSGTLTTVPSRTTWLFNQPQVPTAASSLTFVGRELTPGQAGSGLGGNFTFNSAQSSPFNLVLDLNQNGIYGDGNDRTIVGTATSGNNTVFWDGRDGNGIPVAPSNQAYNAQVEIQAGEIHFPFIDPERNTNGIIVQRVKDSGTSPNPNDPFEVFFDDRYNYTGTNTYDFSLCAAGDTPPPPPTANLPACEGVAPAVRSALNGVSSASGAHRWGDNFGNRRGMDTWAFYPAAITEIRDLFVVKRADLAVTKTDNLTEIAAGSTVTYTIVVTNNGPSDALNSTFRDLLPSQLTNVTWTCTASAGSSCAAANGTGNIDMRINVLNGGSITYTITAVVDPNASGTITNTATVLRPNDVNDPTDPDRTGAGNNSATDITTIVAPTTNVEGQKSVRFFSDVDSSNSVTVGDVVEYALTYRNLAPTATSDVINFVINESLPAQLTYVPGSATITATTGNNIALNPSYNGSGAITTLVTGANSTNSSTLRVGDSVTVRLRATINDANSGNPIDNQAIANFRTPTNATNNTIVTDADSAGATSNPPTVGNPFFQIADDGANTGNGVSTADDDRTSIRVTSIAAVPNLRLVKRITALNNTPYTEVIDDPTDANDDSSLNWTTNYLAGRTGKGITAADTVPVKPGDTLEYTIYFLSDGASAAQTVTLCDLVPANTTFLPSVFNSNTPKDNPASVGDFGLRLTIDNSTVYLSNADDAPDRGRYYAPGTSAPCGNNGTSAIAPNGAVTVQLNNVPNATNKGTPNSFGFIRFQVRVN